MDAVKKTGAEEPSMEEILQSIKKIISEDDPAAKTASPKTNGNGAHAEVPGSDVLELTESMEEAPAAVAAAPVETPAAPPPANNDVLSKIDEALAVTTPPAAAQPPAGDSLLSDQASNAAVSALKKLQSAAEPPLPEVHTTPSPTFGSGKSVEMMVMEMLKPMMKEWLDKNLPAIVERIVTVEIRKLTK